MLPSLFAESLWPLVGILGLVVLFLLRGVVASGNWSRGRLYRQLRTLSAKGEGNPQTLRQAHRAAYASIFWSTLALQLYYGVTLASSFGLLITLLLPLPREIALYLRIVLTLISFSGALILLWYWQGWDDDRERTVHRQLRDIYEQQLAMQGVPARDPLTGLYTKAFFEEELRREANKLLQRPMPISIVILEIDNFPLFRARWGDEVADLTLARVGRAVAQNVRTYDWASRYGDHKFAIGLLRCSPDNAEQVGERVATSLKSLLLEEINRTYRTRLDFIWGTATLTKRGISLQWVSTEAERRLNQRRDLRRLGILTTVRVSP